MKFTFKGIIFTVQNTVETLKPLTAGFAIQGYTSKTKRYLDSIHMRFRLDVYQDDFGFYIYPDGNYAFSKKIYLV